MVGEGPRSPLLPLLPWLAAASVAFGIGAAARLAAPELLVAPLSPAIFVALRPYAGPLSALADRLAALDRPVSPSGILAVHALLTSPGSLEVR